VRISPDLSKHRQIASLHLKPTLKLVQDILQYFLEGILLDQRNDRVDPPGGENFGFDDHSTVEMSGVRSREGAVPRIVPSSCLQDGGCGHFDHFGLQDQGQFLDTPAERQRARFYQVLSFRIHIYWKLMDTKIPTIWITKVNESFLFSNHCLLMMLLPQFCIPLNEVFF
jgi:hypothetical protein